MKAFTVVTLSALLATQVAMADELNSSDVNNLTTNTMPQPSLALEKMQADLMSKQLDKKMELQASKLNDQLEQQIASRMTFAFE